jgi:hypothetical protein
MPDKGQANVRHARPLFVMAGDTKSIRGTIGRKEDINLVA